MEWHRRMRAKTKKMAGILLAMVLMLGLAPDGVAWTGFDLYAGALSEDGPVLLWVSADAGHAVHVERHYPDLQASGTDWLTMDPALPGARLRGPGLLLRAMDGRPGTRRPYGPAASWPAMVPRFPCEGYNGT